jgi:hypothetical protein
VVLVISSDEEIKGFKRYLKSCGYQEPEIYKIMNSPFYDMAKESFEDSGKDKPEEDKHLDVTEITENGFNVRK